MTREEAKRIAQGLITDFKCESETMVEFCNVVIKALEQEPCDDAISRRATSKAVRRIGLCKCNTNEIEAVDECLRAVEDLPPVTPQPKTGHWMRKIKVDGVYDIAGVKSWGIKCQCDKCDFTTTVIEDFGYYKYCPNCGACMKDCRTLDEFIEDSKESEVSNADSN